MKKPKFSVSYRACLGKDDDGKYHYKRFTGTSNASEARALEDAKRQAERWKVLHPTVSSDRRLTVGEAYDGYISMKENVLSPSTVRGYVQLRKAMFQDLMPLRVEELTQQDVQRSVNAAAASHSAKTLRNAHGLLAAVMQMYRPDFTLHTTLPQRMPPTIHVPSNGEIQKLIDYLKATNIELYKAVLLAAFGSLRRSEICALTADDIDCNVITIRKSKVIDRNNQYVLKDTTKTTSSARVIILPDTVVSQLTAANGGSIVDMTPGSITKAFPRALHQLGIEHFRFHDLRHYQASILHALGVPDKYIMARGGWKTDSTLKAVYQHTMDDKRQKVEDEICDYFKSAFNL